MNTNEMYNNFITTINENLLKLQEMTDTISQVHNEVAILLLETSILFHPEVLVKLNEIENVGRGNNRNLTEMEELKNKVHLLNSPLCPVMSFEEFKDLLASAGNDEKGKE